MHYINSVLIAMLMMPRIALAASYQCHSCACMAVARRVMVEIDRKRKRELAQEIPMLHGVARNIFQKHCLSEVASSCADGVRTREMQSQLLGFNVLGRIDHVTKWATHTIANMHAMSTIPTPESALLKALNALCWEHGSFVGFSAPTIRCILEYVSNEAPVQYPKIAIPQPIASSAELASHSLPYGFQGYQFSYSAPDKITLFDPRLTRGRCTLTLPESLLRDTSKVIIGAQFDKRNNLTDLLVISPDHREHTFKIYNDLSSAGIATAEVSDIVKVLTTPTVIPAARPHISHRVATQFIRVAWKNQ